MQHGNERPANLLKNIAEGTHPTNWKSSCWWFDWPSPNVFTVARQILPKTLNPLLESGRNQYRSVVILLRWAVCLKGVVDYIRGCMLLRSCLPPVKVDAWLALPSR